MQTDLRLLGSAAAAAPFLLRNAYAAPGGSNRNLVLLDGRLKALDFDIIVPGHGQPFRERDQIDLYQRFLRDLWVQVSDLRAQGLTAEDATDRVDMTAYESEYGARTRETDPRAVLRIYELLQIQMPL